MKSADSGLFLAKIVKPFHSMFVVNRRVNVLAEHISKLIPENKNLKGLDVGCGTGEITSELLQKRSHIQMDGAEVLFRSDNASIHMIKFDGKTLPCQDKEYDFVMLVDVLHHADDPSILLKECVRVARRFIIIKDHKCDNLWNKMVLNFRDWVGNRAAKVSLPYNFQSSAQWQEHYRAAGLTPLREYQILDIYPKPFYLVWGSNLDFIVNLKIKDHA